MNGVRAHGPGLLLPGTSQSYVVARPIPFYGGWHRYRAEARTSLLGGAEGPAQIVHASRLVVPWDILLLLSLCAAIASSDAGCCASARDA